MTRSTVRTVQVDPDVQIAGICARCGDAVLWHVSLVQRQVDPVRAGAIAHAAAVHA